jgi:serine/threonine protein kinase
MQLIEGPTLADELRSGGMPPERVARYGAALADALAYVHERGLVHRDVKPANVLITEDGRVHLADFGIARLVDSAHQTRTGDVLGTPAYFAPEQVAGEPVGPPADIYALGIVLLECLTGKRPFEGTAMEVAMARLARAPEIPPGTTSDWASLLTAMTRRVPAERPGAEQVADALRLIADGQTGEQTMAMPPPAAATSVMPPPGATQATAIPAAEDTRRRRTGLIVALVLVLVAGIVVAVVLAMQQNDGSDTEVHHGKPKLDQPLERDVRHLEELVTP